MKKLLFVLVILILSTAASAQQSNFSFQTPPIVSPSFKDGQTDSKFGLVYLSIEDDGTLADTKIDMSGGGINFSARKALSDYFAVDFSAGVFATSGDVKTSGLNIKQEMTNVNINFNLEMQPFKTENTSMIIFAGPSLTAINGTTETKGIIDSSLSYTASLYGMQAGLQLGLKAGPVQFIPFIMSSSMSGNITSGGYTTNIDPFTTTSYGLEIMFFDKLSLSSILQEADSSNKDEAGVKTTMYQLSFKMNF